MKKADDGEVTSFGALCTALSATIGTGNIVGVATAIAAGGPGALFWMILSCIFRNGNKVFRRIFWQIKYRTIDEDGHVLGGPFYYIENGMGVTVQMACKDICILWSRGWIIWNRYIYTGEWYLHLQSSNFFDPNMAHTVALFGNDYSWATVISCLVLTVCVGMVVLGGIKTNCKSI